MQDGKVERDEVAETPEASAVREVFPPPELSQFQANAHAIEPLPAQLQSDQARANFPAATPARRKRGASLSRRTGQKGSVFQRSKMWNPEAPTYGKFWVDVPGGDRRQKTIALGACPTRTIARQRLSEHLQREGINSRHLFHQNTGPATTFRQQSEEWLLHLATRIRRPVKPATIAGWQQALNAWLLPHIGDRLLSEVSNGVLRELIGKMTAAGLAPKTIVNYSQVVKLVVASAVTDEGEPVYPRVWNHDFIGLPIVQKEKQHRPTVTQVELEQVLVSVKGRYRMLFALLAGTGLRIGEGLGLKTSDLTQDCRVLRVQRSVWRGQEQEPKTPNAIRDVDLPESLARILSVYITGRSGYIFSTAQGRPLMPRNVLRMLHHTGKRVGFHAFRRYRTAVLRKAQVPEDLITLWLGHARNLTDHYASQLREDELFRSQWCERAGLGFSCDTCYTNVVPMSKVKIA